MYRSGVKWTQRVRSKADNPWMSKQTILERMKADDLWVKADDLGRKQTMFSLNYADDPGQSRRSRGLKAEILS